MEICDLDQVGVSFGSTTALTNITFKCIPGRSTALVGGNGSGKTTLLNVLADLLPVTTGSVERQPSAAISYIGQHQHHHSWMPISAGEVLAMSMYRRLGLLKRLKPADRQLLDDAAERVDVLDLLGKPFGSLSGGQRQRVLVASAIASQPDLLLLDEPVTGLDIPSQQRILKLVNEMTSEGACVILSTHHLDEAKNCDDVMLLANELVALGPTQTTLDPANLRKTFGENVVEVRNSEDASLVIDHHGHGDHAREAMG